MNEDLQIEYSILMKDVSALPDTTSSRYSIDEYGILHLADKADVSTKEERARRVLGAIFPLFTAEDVEDELSKSTISGLHFHAGNYKRIKVLKEIDRKCITDNFDVRLILLLLRYERVIEFNKTPLCQGEYLEDYLDHLISSSEIPYKDTLQALLHEQSGNLVIDDDPDETEVEKINRAIMLLSLLSPEEISEYGMKDINLSPFSEGPLSCFFDESFTPFVPLLLLGSDKARVIFRNPVLRMEVPATSLIDKIVNDFDISLTGGPVAVGTTTYMTILRQCAVSGLSSSEWLFNSDTVYGVKGGPSGCSRFFFETLKEGIADRIYQEYRFIRPELYVEPEGSVLAKTPGHYIFALDEDEFYALENDSIDRVECWIFRKFIVQDGDLRRIGRARTIVDEAEPPRCFYLLDIDFDRSIRKDKGIKVINCDLIEAGLPRSSSLIESYFSREDEGATSLLCYVSPSVIENNGWHLNPDLYWTGHLSEMRHPVRLSTVLSSLRLIDIVKPKSKEKLEQDILETKERIANISRLHPTGYKPLELNRSHLKAIEEDLLSERFKTGCVIRDLQDLPLNNYKEYVSPEDMSPYFDELFYKVEPGPTSHGVLLVDKYGPSARPSYYVAPENEPLYIHEELAKRCHFFEVKEDLADPWFLAYCISEEVDQFAIRLTDGRDGPHVRKEAFLTIMVDLPPIDEQARFVETILREDLMRRRSQLGAAEALLNLSHTIGGPSNRIQTLLGELEESLDGNFNALSALRKIGDNFDYIVRLVNTFSRDLERYPVTLKSTPVVPLVEKNLQAVANLPLGLTPELISCTVSRDRTAFLDDMLFEVMMDNIFRNAYRHGFNRTVSTENRVGVFLSEVSVNGLPHLLMSVRNNGKRLQPGFTIHDFVTKGKTGGDTGNSGQGGYDIYQIVKKFRGRMCLRSNGDWNFIIDILLPLESAAGGSGDIEPYPHGPLV